MKKYTQKKSKSGMTKIYLGNEPISDRMNMGNTYEWYEGVNEYIFVSFQQFVELHKQWVNKVANPDPDKGKNWVDNVKSY